MPEQEESFLAELRDASLGRALADAHVGCPPAVPIVTAGEVIDGLMQMVLEQRAAAKAAKDWATSDHIRDALKALGIQVKDTKDGAEWTLE